MQNVTAGPPEPKRRTIGQEVAQRCDPSAVRRVKFGILQNGVVHFWDSLNAAGFNYEVADNSFLFSLWQKFRAALQNVTAGPSEQKRRTIGREVAQGYEPSPPA